MLTAIDKRKAVAEALTELGTDIAPMVVCQHLAKSGVKIDPEEVVRIRGQLLKEASTPPGPDQPPPAP